MLVWNPEGADERVWRMLREHLTDVQIVELGSFIAVTYGQQRVIKTWGVGHGELPGDSDAGLPRSGSHL
jgi:alkylhydroperoxidase family enzyme